MKKLAKNCKYDTIDYIPLESRMDNPSPGALLVNINKMSNIFTLDLKSFANALVIAVIIGIGAAIGYVLKVGDIFAIDVHSLANVFALAVLGGVATLISSFLTTSQGKFAGAIPVR